MLVFHINNMHQYMNGLDRWWATMDATFISVQLMDAWIIQDASSAYVRIQTNDMRTF